MEQQTVFQMVKKLYKWFNGDVVQIERALSGPWDKISAAFDNDFNNMSYIKAVYSEFELEPEDIKGYLSQVEYYAHACEHHMTLEEYETSGLGEEIEGRITARKSTFDIDKHEPLEAKRIEDLLSFVHTTQEIDPKIIEDVLSDGWICLLSEEFGKVDLQKARKLQDTFAMFWVTPKDVGNWMKENSISVEEVFELFKYNRKCDKNGETMKSLQDYADEKNFMQRMAAAQTLSSITPEFLNDQELMTLRLREALRNAQQTRPDLNSDPEIEE